MSSTTPKTKLLAIGDPHFKVDNMEESQHFYTQISTWLQENKVDYIIILGDILHSHEKIYTFALNMAVNFIKMCSSYATTYCLVGNHDATSNTIYCGKNHWLHVLNGTVENVVIVESPTFIEDLNMICCPYVSDGRFVEMLEEYVDGWKECDCIFAHQLFNGAKMGGIVAQDVEEWKVEYPTIISGHLHDKQKPQENLVYVGSSQQLAFSESSDKSICLIVYEGSNIQMEEVYLNLKQRKTLYSTVEDVMNLKMVANTQYKIVIRDQDSACKAFKKTAKYKELMSQPCIRSIQFKPVVNEEEEKKTPTFACDFLSVLHKRIEGENVYLQSYANSLLTGSEDMSDKDVILL